MHVLFVQRCRIELRGRCNLVHSPMFVDDQFAQVFSRQNFPLYDNNSLMPTYESVEATSMQILFKFCNYKVIITKIVVSRDCVLT